MGKGYHIARVFGINIRVGWKWILVILLITGSFSYWFTKAHPDWGIWLVCGVALAVALLFFVSVLVHELAHLLVTKAGGIPVRNSRLFLYGGVSNIGREPSSPIADILTAFIGPLTSIALGILLMILGGFSLSKIRALIDPLTTIAMLSPLRTLFLCLGYLNVILGVINLVPGFPLDGGRILRSIFWVISGNVSWATRAAAGIGQLIAGLMVLGGFLMLFRINIPFIGSGIIKGLWLMLIAWFLHGSAVISYRQVAIKNFLGGIPVERLIDVVPTTVAPDMTIDRMVDNGFLELDEYALPVVEDGELCGMIIIDDARRVPKDLWSVTTIYQVMIPTDRLVLVASEDDVAEALNKLQSQDVRQLPVVRNDILVGWLRRRDIAKWWRVDSEVIFSW